MGHKGSPESEEWLTEAEQSVRLPFGRFRQSQDRLASGVR